MSSRFGAPRFPPFFSWLKNPFRRQWSSFLIISGPTVPQLNDHLRFANSHSFLGSLISLFHLFQNIKMWVAVSLSSLSLWQQVQWPVNYVELFFAVVCPWVLYGIPSRAILYNHLQEEEEKRGRRRKEIQLCVVRMWNDAESISLYLHVFLFPSAIKETTKQNVNGCLAFFENLVDFGVFIIQYLSDNGQPIISTRNIALFLFLGSLFRQCVKIAFPIVINVPWRKLINIWRII
jgi:hypothetical protein